MAPVQQLSLLQQLDAQLEQFFAGWNTLSTVLVVVVIAVVFSPLFIGSEPDIHPFLLSRQSSAGLVRQPGESAAYRSAETPHGYPLRAGLNVKEDGAPAYIAGRNGDLRDIWRKLVKDGGSKQKIISARGRDVVQSKTPTELSKEIVAIGKHLQAQGSTNVLVLLHNSTELLLTLFAGAFYGFTPILVSPARYNEAILAGLIRHTEADALIAPAGLLPPAAVEANKGLKTTIWVVEPNSRHMDFASDDVENSIHWHDITDKSSSTDLPAPTKGDETPGLTVLSPKTSSGETFEGDFVDFTAASVIAAVAAQVSAQPRRHQTSSNDLILPLESLADLYPLVVTLAALWQGASVALISAAGGPKVDYDLAFATKGLKPTIIVASSAVMARARANKLADSSGLVASYQKNSHARSMAAGVLKVASGEAGGLRLIYVSETPTAVSDSVPLSGQELADLRFLTKSRIIYSLVVPRVAGALAQTNQLDYRNDSTSSKRSHFGPPLGSVEVKLTDTVTHRISDDSVKGEIVASGPAVLGGVFKTGLLGHVKDDGTLALV